MPDTTPPDTTTIRFAVPKGRMYDGVASLLKDAGIGLHAATRNYRPAIDLPGFETKILKPHAIIEMLAAGTRDLGFAGADWVAEHNLDLVELLDTGLDRVRLVAAAPETILVNNDLPKRPIVVASEYAHLTTTWFTARGYDATLLRSYGATEVLPPEDADCIVDNTATGSTLAANGLRIIDELMTSSTRLYASPAAYKDPTKRPRIDTFVTLVESVLSARGRVMLELNVSAENLDAIVDILPCMREPTVSTLHRGGGFAVKAAVPRHELAALIPNLQARGGTDIIVTRADQIVS